MTLPKHSQRHCCDIMGFKACLYSSLQIKVLISLRDYILGVEYRRYENTNNWDLLVVNSLEWHGTQYAGSEVLLKMIRTCFLPGDSRSWESPEKADNVWRLFIQILLR